MGKQIFIIDDEVNLSVERVENLPTVVYHGTRDEIEDASKHYNYEVPGVYFLIGKSEVYVGQSSTSVYRRLSRHNKNKDWWHEYFIITDDHGEIEKTVAEFMEKYFIDKFSEHGITLTNDTEGNETRINNLTLLRANKLITKAEETIIKFFKYDLFNPEFYEAQRLEMSKDNTEFVVDIEGYGYLSSKTKVGLLQNVLVRLADKHYPSLYMMCLEEDLEGLLENLNTSKKYPSDVKISGDIYLNKNLDDAKAIKLLDLIVAELDLSIKNINF